MVGIRQSGRRLLALLVLTLTTSAGLAHVTTDMEELELVTKSWATGMLTGNRTMLAGSMDANMSASLELAQSNRLESRESFLDFLMPTLREARVENVLFDYVTYSPLPSTPEPTVHVGPLVTLQGSGLDIKTAWFLDVAKTAAGWKIRHISGDVVRGLPAAILDVDRPERHAGLRTRFEVLDQDSGQPLAGRVSILDEQGRYWPPDGHQFEIKTGMREDVGGDIKVGDRTFAYVEPVFTATLPPGRYQVEAHHGMEYEPQSLRFEIRPGDAAPVAVRLRRWIDMNATGWYSGDTHVHFVKPRNASLEGRGEGVNVVNVLAAKWGNLVTSVDDFSGGPDPVSTPETIVYVNEEARHGYLGHTALLGLRQLVFPLSWGSAPATGVPGGIDYPPMALLADEAHQQGAHVAWAHFPNPRGEVAVDIALGKVDSVDLLTWGDPLFRQNGQRSRADVWYGLLNCGFRLPATAGTDKMFNTQVIGTPRVYVRLDGGIRYDGWLGAIRLGRTFVTTGPMLSLRVDGHDIGAVLNRAAGESVEIVASVRSNLPVDAVEIVSNGVVVASRRNEARSDELILRTRLPIAGSSWIAARARSSAHLPYQTLHIDRADDIPVFAHTSPIYVDVADRPLRSAADAAFFVTWIDDGIAWLRAEARVSAEPQRTEMISLFERARAVYTRQIEARPVRAGRSSP